MMDAILVGATVLFPAVAGLFFFLWKRGNSEPQPAVSLEDERLEPVIGGGEKVIPPKVPPAPAPEVIVTAESFPKLPETLKEEVHYIVKLWQDSAKPMDEQAFGELVENLAGHCLGSGSLLAFEPEKGKWESPRLETEYACYLWITALSNRQGRLDESNIAAIEGYATRFAAERDMFVECPKRAEIVENIELLDRFCEEVDQVLNIYLAGAHGDRGQRNSVQSIRELALAEGLVDDNKGDVACYVENQRLFILRARNGGTLTEEPPTRILRGLKLEMDTPHLSDPAGAFDTMVDLAGRLAKSLHFAVVNDRNVPITDEDFRDYRARIAEIREKMDAYGVVAGSTAARTLFS